MKAVFGERIDNFTQLNDNFMRILKNKVEIEQNQFKYPKSPLKVDEMLDYPHFFKQRKANLANARKLQIQQKSPVSSKPQFKGR
jgi:hypothetical protein